MVSGLRPPVILPQHTRLTCAWAFVRNQQDFLAAEAPLEGPYSSTASVSLIIARELERDSPSGSALRLTLAPLSSGAFLCATPSRSPPFASRALQMAEWYNLNMTKAEVLDALIERVAGWPKA